MSNDNIEVEIKIKLDKEKFSNVRQKLNEVAKFVKKSQHQDQYFTPVHRNFMEPNFPFEWVSIRKRGNRTILNYKHWHPAFAEVHTHCDEFETVIENPDQLKKIFSVLNFKELVTVEKERETYVFNDEFEIVLDTVKELGHFIEIEAMKDFGGIKPTRKKLFKFAKNLGISDFKPDERGYPYRLMKKKGLIN